MDEPKREWPELTVFMWLDSKGRPQASLEHPVSVANRGVQVFRQSVPIPGKNGSKKALRAFADEVTRVLEDAQSQQQERQQQDRDRARQRAEERAQLPAPAAPADLGLPVVRRGESVWPVSGGLPGLGRRR